MQSSYTIGKPVVLLALAVRVSVSSYEDPFRLTAYNRSMQRERRRSQEYFINEQQNLETLNHDLSVASWDLTIPWSGTCEGITSNRSCDFTAHMCTGMIHENYKLFVNPLFKTNWFCTYIRCVSDYPDYP